MGNSDPTTTDHTSKQSRGKSSEVSTLSDCPVVNDYKKSLVADIKEDICIIKTRLEQHGRALFGDYNNPKENRGLINDFSHLEREQKVTNNLLMDMKNDNRRFFWTFLSAAVVAVVSAIVALLFRVPMQIG